jgi:hypothetical protein
MSYKKLRAATSGTELVLQNGENRRMKRMRRERERECVCDERMKMM